jgi:hypothetical protein
MSLYRMDGFKYIFDDAEQNYNNSDKSLDNFRYNRRVYGFCINEGGIDEQSINHAKQINEELSAKFLNQSKSMVGYKGHEEKFLPVDDLDSKHIMQLTFLLHNSDMNYGKIVEIGGGFGNMARLCNGILTFKQWDIIDIPHMLQVQKYYLDAEIGDTSKINFINAYSNVNYRETPIHVVIGTHSLSEFSWSVFENYFHTVVQYSEYLFLGYNKHCPSEALIRAKLDYITTHNFIVEKQFEYSEKTGANVVYTLFKNNSFVAGK